MCDDDCCQSHCARMGHDFASNRSRSRCTTRMTNRSRTCFSCNDYGSGSPLTETPSEQSCGDQPNIEYGMKSTFNIYENERSLQKPGPGLVCNFVKPPWAPRTDKHPFSRHHLKPFDENVTEYQDKFRCQCTRQFAYKRIVVPYARPIPLHERPRWNKSIKVPPRTYQESLAAAEAKLALLDGIVVREYGIVSPQDRMAMIMAQREARENLALTGGTRMDTGTTCCVKEDSCKV